VLKYERGKDHAPVVLAKGENRFAQRLKALAAEHGVPTVENKPVARMLYAMGELKLELERLRREGFVRVRVDGEIVDLGDDIVLDRAQNGAMRFPIRVGEKVGYRDINYPLIPKATELSRSSVLVAGLDALLFPFASSLTVGETTPNLKVDVLAESAGSSGSVANVRSLDPEDAPNATARQEVERIFRREHRSRLVALYGRGEPYEFDLGGEPWRVEAAARRVDQRVVVGVRRARVGEIDTVERDAAPDQPAGQSVQQAQQPLVGEDAVDQQRPLLGNDEDCGSALALERNAHVWQHGAQEADGACQRLAELRRGDRRAAEELEAAAAHRRREEGEGLVVEHRVEVVVERGVFGERHAGAIVGQTGGVDADGGEQRSRVVAVV